MHTTAGVFLPAGEAGDVTPRYHLCSLHLAAFNTESSTPTEQAETSCPCRPGCWFQKVCAQ